MKQIGRWLCALNFHKFEFAGITYPTTGAWVKCIRPGCDKLRYRSWL